MVPLNAFNRISYKKLRHFKPQCSLQSLIGLDSEAYTNGATFMFCTSSGYDIRPETFLEVLFTDFWSTNFVVWNLKYESGAILKCFPVQILKTLQQHHKIVTEYRGRRIELSYIPHKRLRMKEIAFGGRAINFWDISPFYGRTKLDTAAQTYLHESKMDMDTSLFTPEYVLSNRAAIAEYCVKDALLTQKLASLWVDTFERTGIKVTSLYSEASISFNFMTEKSEVVTPWEFWERNRKLIRYAFESYEGGRFEILARGKFEGYEYDISSAYPYEIANLVDTRNSRVVYSSRYIKESTYAYLRCRISVTDPDIHLPCGVFRKLRTYPIGSYYLTITKQEYDYITSEIPKGFDIDVIDGAWLIIPKISYPYKKIFNELYDLKTYWKKKDRLRSNNYKTIMNGFYGKMGQCLPSTEGNYIAGPGWNPLYATVITANTRIAVTRLQNILRDDCLAVHTDSIITRSRLPDRLIGSGLGQFELVEQGKGVLVACGVYEINGRCALKGFRKNSIMKILKENPGRKKITLSLRHVESWVQAMAQNHAVDKINLFSDVPKTLTLNCDTKRQWEKEVTSDDLLNSLQFSSPLIYREDEPPVFWNDFS